jgi:formylglycine-generating enzyme required for sulfatase activity
MRATRRYTSMGAAVALLAVGAYFAPAIWRFSQQFLPADQQPNAVAAPVDTGSLNGDEQPVIDTLPQTPTYTAGHTFSDCPSCPEMVVLPGGIFVMGSPASETGRGRDEGPQREVSMSPFAIGKYEITFAQWDSCLAGGGCNGFSPPDNGWGRGSRPVTGVSWNDVQSYLDWLNQQAGGLRYRLASEAEWEYAARAGAADAYAFGPRVTATQATFRARQTTPVGEHDANAWALFDMHGNVGEWVEDCYVANYNAAPIDGAAVQANNCARHVYRGGGFSDQAQILRAAARQSAPADRRVATIGFRVARTLD